MYVLHSFQKESTRGIKTPQRDLDIIETRFKQVEARHKERRQSQDIKGARTVAEVGEAESQKEVRFTPSSGNVFEDLPLDDPEEISASNWVSDLIPDGEVSPTPYFLPE